MERAPRRRVRRRLTRVRAAGCADGDRERERGGQSGWLEAFEPGRCSVIGQNSIEGLVCLPQDLAPGQFLPLPSHGCASFIHAQPVASCQGCWQRRRPRRLQYRSQQRRPPVSGFSLARDRKVSSSFGVTRRLRYVTLSTM